MPIAPRLIQEHDPWKKEGIKHIPFHSYIRKNNKSTLDEGKIGGLDPALPSRAITIDRQVSFFSQLTVITHGFFCRTIDLCLSFSFVFLSDHCPFVM